MFITPEGNFVSTVDELLGKKDWNEFLEENVPIWKKTISALGYFFIEQKNSILPIWLKNPLPEQYAYKNKKVELFTPVNEYSYKFDSWMCNNLLEEDKSIALENSNWSPNFILEQAFVLERKLLEWGKYNGKDVDFNLGQKRLIGLRYYESEIYRDLYAAGKSEPKLITDLFMNFIDNKKNLRRKI